MTRDPLAAGDPLAQRRFAYAHAAADEGDFAAAAEVLEQALERAPDWAAAWFALGEARQGRGDAPPVLPPAYIARLFDQYAPRFEAHLTERLGYRAPALIAEALGAAAPARRFANALDLGCGAGLMGEALRERID